MTGPHFTQPKIIHYDKDLSKKWFVYFRYYHKGKWQQKIVRAKINRYNTVSERMRESVYLRDALSHMLRHENWNPFEDEYPTRENITLIKAIDEMLATRRNMKPKSIRTYNDIGRMFKSWLSQNGYKHLYAHNFKPVMARAYLDYLLIQRKYCGKSHNGQLGILKTLFNAMLEREIIEKNPFKGIKELPEDTGKNVAYTADEQKRIKEYLYAHNRRLYYAVQFIYYCFLRRSELIRLRVADIDFNNMTIRIPSEVSKNRRQESVTIPRSFEPVLYEMGLDRIPEDYYIFGFRFQTCGRKMAKPDNLTYSFKKVLDKLAIKGKSLYAFKHTGAVALYEATRDPYIVSRQCRHSELKITMIYLRSLGLTVDEAVRRADFRF